MPKIQIESKNSALGNVIGVTPRAREIVMQIQNETGLSARDVVSKIIIQAYDKNLIEITSENA